MSGTSLYLVVSSLIGCQYTHVFILDIVLKCNVLEFKVIYGINVLKFTFLVVVETKLYHLFRAFSPYISFGPSSILFLRSSFGWETFSVCASF